MGPPIDLWDTDWANGGGYYWTVLPVDAKVPGTLTTTISGIVNKTEVPVDNASGFAVGDAVTIGSPGNVEAAAIPIAGISGNTLTLAAQPTLFHFLGEPVTRKAGTILRYTDAELAQDVCAAGRIMRFGKAERAGADGERRAVRDRALADAASSPRRTTRARSTARRSSRGRPRSGPRSTRCSGARRRCRSTPRPIPRPARSG